MSLQFDGTQNSASAPDSASLRLTDGTYAVWVNAASASSGSIMEKWSSSLSLALLSGNVIAQIQDEAGPMPSAAMPLGSWHHVAATFDHTTGTLALYLDGVLKGTASGTYSITSTSAFYLGYGRNSYADVALANAQVWSRILSASEIAGLANGTAPSNQSGLVAQWPLLETAGTAAHDLTANANTLTLAGSPLPVWSADGPARPGVGPLHLIIGGTDLSGSVEIESFQIEQVLTRRGDSARVRLVDPTNTLTIARLASVQITDNQANVLFSGWVTKQRKLIGSAAYREFELTCQDATIFLAGRKANKRYSQQHVTDIARDLVLNASPATGLTATNTTAGQGPVIDFDVTYTGGALDYQLTRLAKIASASSSLTNLIFDWYVDYNKDLHFFYASQAPSSGVTLTDAAPSGSQLNYNRDSFFYEIDDTQLGNAVLVRGGTTLAAWTDQFTGDGSTTAFALRFAPDINSGGMPAVTVGGVAQTVGQATGTTPTTQWVVSQAATSQVWYLAVGTASAPGNGVSVKCSYEYDVPIFAAAQNSADVSALSTLPNTGQFDRMVGSTTIADVQSAISRANSELAAYGTSYKNGRVDVQQITTGAVAGALKAGATVALVNSQHGINESALLIVKATIKAKGPTVWAYSLDLQG